MSSGDSYSPYYPYGSASEGNPVQFYLQPPPPTNWNLPQHQFTQNYGRSSGAYNPNSINHNMSQHSHRNNQNNRGNSHGNSNRGSLRSRGYNHHSSAHPSRSYFRNRYPNQHSQYNSGNQQHGWQRNQNNKRFRVDSVESSGEPQLKTSKKKKKPLSQNTPSKKEWTVQEADFALSVEKELNKKSKNALIIKFPDQELNKDIVGQFHESIENVHFQQPCTPRFCFVTLKESANAELVKSALNEKKFGDGLLTVEFKKDREEDQTVIGADIDPLTLYVGNLAQEITKEDMLKMYPNCKRIDIGFAKKMKFTRYAFVGFRTVPESVESFRNTHNMQMYNKSLIVRFRRLHGTVGMPGESKPQNPPKSKDSTTVPAASGDTLLSAGENLDIIMKDKMPAAARETSSASVCQSDNNASTEGICDTASLAGNELNLEDIKQEHASPADSEDEVSYKTSMSDFPLDLPYISNQLTSRGHEIMEVKKEHETPGSLTLNAPTLGRDIKQQMTKVKDEPVDNYNMWNDSMSNDEDSDDGDNDGLGLTDFDSIYESMVIHAKNINTLKRNGI